MIAAVITIGANEIRMKAAQARKDGLKILENASMPLYLGRDTFTHGKVGFEKTDRACEIINNFIRLAKQYGDGVRFRLCATSAIREARNRDYVVEQIRLRTGLKCRVLDDYDEKFYVYKLTRDLLDDGLKKSALLAYIGGGNLGCALLDDGRIPYSQNVRVGSLRLGEAFGDRQDYSKDFPALLEEYLRGFTMFIKRDLPSGIQNFIANGHRLYTIAKLCGFAREGSFIIIGRDRFEELYASVKRLNPAKLTERYDITAQEAEHLTTAMCIYGEMLSFTEADRIISPHIYLVDALLYEELFPERFRALDKMFLDDALRSAERLAEKFDCDMPHARTVADFATTIFDKTRKLHGLGDKERVLLNVAALLHDCGKFINTRSHAVRSYDIIRGLDITGLNGEDTRLCAAVAYYHSKAVPTAGDGVYESVEPKRRVVVAALAALLRAADALNNGHRDKISRLDVRYDEDEGVVVTAETGANIELEQWAFEDKCDFFHDVFGKRITLRRKRG